MRLREDVLLPRGIPEAAITLLALLIATGAILGLLGSHPKYTHHCHEDEFQYVTPRGLECYPVDDLVMEPPRGRVVVEDYDCCGR